MFVSLKFTKERMKLSLNGCAFNIPTATAVTKSFRDVKRISYNRESYQNSHRRNNTLWFEFQLKGERHTHTEKETKNNEFRCKCQQMWMKALPKGKQKQISYCAFIVWVSHRCILLAPEKKKSVCAMTNNISLLAQIHISQTFRLHLLFLELFLSRAVGSFYMPLLLIQWTDWWKTWHCQTWLCHGSRDLRYHFGLRSHNDILSNKS